MIPSMLTKSNFIKFLDCSCQLWLIKQRPELLPPVEAWLQRIFDEGNKVDVFAKKLFPKGVEIGGFNETGAKNTKKVMAEGATVMFQPTFTGNGITCRSEILVKKGNAWDIHEVKSSTGVKDEHVFDLAFQRICLEDAGVKVGKTFLVHVNNKFVKKGEIDPHQFLTTVDISEQVEDLLPLARKEIVRAQETLKWSESAGLVHLSTCKSPKKCEFLPLCIGTIPDKTLYSIAPELPKKKLKAFVERGLIKPKQVPPDVLDSLGPLTLPTNDSREAVEIDKKGIARELKELEFPLYFLDYETFYPAIPVFDGYRPYQQMTFQYSVHVMDKPGGKLAQYDYIHEVFEDPAAALTESLLKHIGPEGSVIVWNERFEAARNEELGRMLPKHAKRLRSINERMYDLMQIVKGGYYVDSRFEGSASLKMVLPVLCPDLSYEDLVIQEGETASASWAVLTDPKTSPTIKKRLKRDMLAYCERDTLAMVRLYEKFLAAAK